MAEDIPDGYAPNAEVNIYGPVPSYVQLAAILRARIQEGRYPPERPIPSESQLMGETGLARGTVRRAVALLAETGYVVTVRGRGSFVPPERFNPDGGQE